MGLVEYNYEELLEQAREQDRWDKEQLMSRLVGLLYWWLGKKAQKLATQLETEEMVREAVKWLNSKKGQRKIMAALEIAKRSIAKERAWRKEGWVYYRPWGKA